MTYEISMAWPEFAARMRELRAIPGSTQRPGMGLVAELVAESGQGAGRLDLIDPATATPTETCQVPGGGIAAELYAMLPGEPPDGMPRTSCSAAALGQRCLLTAISCGAEQVRARWTAPPLPVGPIWFSAGFVTTEAISGTVVNDAVLEVANPIQSVTAANPRYESTLEGGCRIANGAAGTARARGRGASLPIVASLPLMLIALALWWRKGRRRSSRRSSGAPASLGRKRA
jgi:hypothetical protein